MPRRSLVLATFAAASAALLASACSDRSTAPTAAAAQQVTSPVPRPAPVPVRGAYKLSGLVTESTPQGVRPSSGASVNAWIQEERLGYSYWWANGRVVADAAGRYELPGLPPGVTARVDVWKEGYVQQCAAPLLTIHGDVTLDAQLVSRANLSASISSVPPPAPGFRFVSGVIYEGTNADKRPVADAFVDYEPVMDFPAAVTVSDSEGRYLLCGLPEGETALIVVGFQGRVTWVSVPPFQSTGVDIVLPR